jgi:hypothetical protein
MDDEDPTVASTAPDFDWDSLTKLSIPRTTKSSATKPKIEVAAHEAMQNNEITETKTEVWKRVSN